MLTVILLFDAYLSLLLKLMHTESADITAESNSSIAGSTDSIAGSTDSIADSTEESTHSIAEVGSSGCE